MQEQFRFNGDYNDKAQVEPYLEAFSAIRKEITNAGQYPYNASFKGRIAGLNPATSKDEDTAIYMLQCLFDIRAEQQQIADLKAEGYRPLETLADRSRFSRVVVYRAGHFVGGTGWIATYDNVRILTDENHRPLGLLEKGKRTHARSLHGCQVLAKAGA